MSIVDDTAPGAGASHEEVRRYLDAQRSLETTADEVEGLESSVGVETFKQQLDLLKRRLVEDPAAFRDMFIEDGVAAAAWEFEQDELSDEFLETLWSILLKDSDASVVMMRFIWSLSVGKKRKFIRAVDRVLSDRYPMLEGLLCGLARERRHPAVHPRARRARRGLRAGQQGLPGLHGRWGSRLVRWTCWCGSRCCATSSARSAPARWARTRREAPTRASAAAPSGSTSPR